MSTTLLRGIIDFGSGLSQEAMAANFQRLRDSGYKWADDQPADEKLYRFVTEFFQRELDIPTAKVMADFFQRKDDIETFERLKDVKEATPFDGANYKFVLDQELTSQRIAWLVGTAKEVIEIAHKGKTFGEGRHKKRLHGIKDALAHLDEADLYGTMLPDDIRPIVRASLQAETEGAWDDYQAGKGKALGLYSGFGPFDSAVRGLRRGQIWIHAAYTSQMKTTLAQNVAYNASTRYRRNVVYVSLEMTREELRDSMLVMHSAHPRFGGRPPLDYLQIRNSELNSEGEDFYREVLDDYTNGGTPEGERPEYCRVELVTVTEGMTMESLRQELERIDREMEIGLLILDHTELIESTHRTPNTTERVNEIYKQLSRLALHFDGGKGLAVMALHQTSRQGWLECQKNDHRYTGPSALSYSNEAPRAGSIITAGILTDEGRQSGRLKIQCLKNRGNAFFEDFDLHVNWPSRRLSYITPEERAELAGMAVNDPAIERMLGDI